jgi:hypothetical protein
MLKSCAGRTTTTGKPFFKCANCDALYHVIKVDAGLKAADRKIMCFTCGSALRAQDGNFAFKYFPLGNPGRGQKSKNPSRSRSPGASDDRLSKRLP